MGEVNTILTPIRYPLTAESTKTLEYAGELALEHDAELYILHVNLLYHSHATTASEIETAIGAVLDEPTPTVCVRSGFLIEEIVVEELSSLDADLIVLGKNQKPRWRRLLSRLTGNTPDITDYLRKHVQTPVETVE